MNSGDKQYRDLAQTIANQAQALADGRVAIEHAMARTLLYNTETLVAWTTDDRQHSTPREADDNG